MATEREEFAQSFDRKVVDLLMNLKDPNRGENFAIITVGFNWRAAIQSRTNKWNVNRTWIALSGRRSNKWLSN